MRTYFDHNATTPVDPEVLEEMLPYFAGSFGNPASIHHFGQDAKRALDVARERVASLVFARPEEILFTSGGTESNNWAISGVTGACEPGAHVVTTEIEHSAVLAPIQALEGRGMGVTRVSPDSSGRIDPEVFAGAVDGETVLASVMLANNDVGTIQPVREICEAVGSKKVLVHCDAVQGTGKIPVNLAEMGVDFASMSAHKIYGPKGVGALYIRRGTDLRPQFLGGHQEFRRRGGTENIPGIVGFGKACELAKTRLDIDGKRIGTLRDRLESKICSMVGDVVVHGVNRLPGTLNCSFKGVEGDGLVMLLDLNRVAVSTGAACSSSSRLPSHVLMAMGCSQEESLSSVRFSLGRCNTQGEVDGAATLVADAVTRLRGV